MPAATTNVRSVQPIGLPIGVSDFAALVQGNYTFVDKSLLIEGVLRPGAQVRLMTRPRRFGKTLNLSMLQHFFARKAYGQDTRGLFKGLQIAGRPAAMAHQGQYPVIFLSFKELKGESFEEFVAHLRTLLAKLYRQYPELLRSGQVDADSLRDVRAIRAKRANLSDMADAVRLLCAVLHQHYGQQVVILLDEYDTPIHAAYSNGYYPKLIKFMKNLLGAALKDNPFLFKSVVTGILRVSKENLFSDLNNIDVYSVLDEDYSTYFGFTEPEVSRLLEVTGLAAKQSELEERIKDWYNGYRFGSQVIYNPWSIINCLNRDGQLSPWWIGTSGSDILKTHMARADADFKEGLEDLIQGRTVRETIDPKLVFADLDSGSGALWSLLLFSGYLTAVQTSLAEGRVECELAVPNREIRYFYENTIRSWFVGTGAAKQMEKYGKFMRSVAEGDLATFEPLLQDYLLRTVSFFDPTGKDPEKFYHGLVLGMMLGLQESHDIKSNRESGLGRYDVALFPKKGSGHDLGVILEFKQAARQRGLRAAANAALAQIDRKRYRTELQEHAVKRILAIGMAFAGKKLAIAHSFSSGNDMTP